MKKKISIKKSKDPSQKLKELMKAVKKAGGNEEQMIKAKQVFKNYYSNLKKKSDE